MTAQDRKAIARRFFEEVWNQQKLKVVDEIFAPTLLFNWTVVSREAIKQLVTARRTAFPDVRVTVDDQVAEDDNFPRAERGRQPIRVRTAAWPPRASA
jgi:hypothetical protein